MKSYNIVADIYRDKNTFEINSNRIFDVFKAIFNYLVLIIMEITNYLFYFIVFLSCLSYLASMDKDIAHYGVAYLSIEETNTKTLILSRLLRSICGVFLFPLKISITLSIVSWVILVYSAWVFVNLKFLVRTIIFLSVVFLDYLAFQLLFIFTLGKKRKVWYVLTDALSNFP